MQHEKASVPSISKGLDVRESLIASNEQAA